MAQDSGMTPQVLRAQAAAWVVRLSDAGCSEAERAAFDAWRRQSPAHDATYEREAAAWDRLDRLRALRPGSADPDPDLLAPAHSFFPWQRALEIPRRRLAVAAVVALLIVSTAIAPSLVLSPAYATGVGERRLVLLDDGSKVELNTDSKIVVRYGKGVREVELVRGEALFAVADDARPFEIVANDTRLQAAGSEMNVRIRAQETAVTVAQGTVAIAQTTRTPIATLTAGTQAVYGPAGDRAQPVSRDKIDRTLAWRRGFIDLDGQTLAQAAEEFNRYNTRQLVVQDETIGAIRLGGYFRTDDLEGFVQALRKSFPVNPIRMRDGRVMLARAG
jgi:transmembrane sensor